MTGRLTRSEAAFEDFLHAHNLPFERVAEADTPRPDYRVTIGALSLMFEVKELTKDASFRQGTSSRTIGDHIRSKITQSRKQIRFGSDQGIPSIMLVYNDIDPMHMFGTENHDFTDAMYGARTLLMDKESLRVVDVFHGREKSFSPTTKTYFSALGRLAPCRDQMTVTLFQNLHAAVPLPYDALPLCFEIIRYEQEKKA